MGKIILNGTEYAGSGGSSGVIYLPTIYSDEERVVGVWRDNKPLYQKSITVNSVNLPADDGVDVLLSDYGINDVEKIIDIKGRNETVNAYVPYLSQGGNTLYLITLSSENPLKIRISRNGGAISNQTFVITVQYTKTTDTAGSGDWNTDGVPTHHYSTNEQVIGTYLGKTLYEKVYVNNGSDITANSGNWTTICSETWVQNVKQIVNSLLSRQAYSASSTGIFTPCEFMAENGAIKINPFRNLTFKSGAYFVIQYTQN